MCATPGYSANFTLKYLNTLISLSKLHYISMIAVSMDEMFHMQGCDKTYFVVDVISKIAIKILWVKMQLLYI